MNSYNGGGFVYFNNSSPKQSQTSLDTSDFLSFSSESSPGNSPQKGNFCPSNFSSPCNTNFYGKAHKNRVGRNNFPGHQRGYGGKPWLRNAGLTNSNEQNNFCSNAAQSSFNRKPFRNNAWRNHQRFGESSFYDSSCMEDPWQELESELLEKSRLESDLSNKISEKSSSESPSGSSSEDSDKSEEMEDSLS